MGKRERARERRFVVVEVKRKKKSWRRRHCNPDRERTTHNYQDRNKRIEFKSNNTINYC